MVRYIGKIVCLHSFQTIKVNRFVGRKVEQKKKVNFSILPNFITFSKVIYVRKNKLILVKSNYCFDQLVNKDYTTTSVTQLSNIFTVITRCNYSDI